jgi:very-short-patch-repair endonuclease
MREGQKTFTARRLRRDETFAEKRLWQQLRNRQFEGLKFVRQAPVGPYIADFLCRELKLILEVDGATHSTDAELARDRQRTHHLKDLGYMVFRLQNDEVVNGMDEVLTLIREALARVPSSPPLLRNGSPSSPVSREKTEMSSPAQRQRKGAHRASDGIGEGLLAQKGRIAS